MTYEEILEQPRKSINAEELQQALKDTDFLEKVQKITEQLDSNTYLLGKILQYKREERQQH